jgi:DNA gyrase/topoisomerase IV subunit A
MNERQQAHIDHYLRRLAHWRERKPISSTARLLAARDADEAHPLRSEEEATEVVEYLWRLEREKAGGERREMA